MYKAYSHIFLLFLFISNHAYSMKISPQKLSLPDGIELGIEEIWLNIIAQCPAKRNLRETCRYLRDTASVSNEKLFLQNPLVIKPDILKRFMFYYAELDNAAIVSNLLNQAHNLEDGTLDKLLRFTIQNENVMLADIVLNHPACNMNQIPTYIFDDYLQHCPEIAKHMLTSKTVEKFAPSYYKKISDKNADILDHILSLAPCDSDTLFTLLCKAAKNGYIKIATIVLKYNVNVNTIDVPSGFTPVHAAARHGQTRMIKLFMNHGATINNLTQNEYPSSPIELAIHHAHVNTVQFLINQGADLTTKQIPLLHRTMRCNSYETYSQIIPLLLGKGVDVNEKYDRGVPLVEAIYTGDTRLVQLLLAYPDIDVNAQNDNNKTPLDVAILACGNEYHNRNYNVKEYGNIKKILIEHGAKTSAELAQTTEHK